jgi:homoserine dehydrogenase
MAQAASNKNALYFKGDAIGEVFITGAGAGGMATASGVVADLLTLLAGRPGPLLLKKAAPVPSISIAALEEI